MYEDFVCSNLYLICIAIYVYNRFYLSKVHHRSLNLFECVILVPKLVNRPFRSSNLFSYVIPVPKFGFRVIWKETITILPVWRYAIGIHAIGKIPLQFYIYHSQAIIYISPVHGPTCQTMYFCNFLYCPWAHPSALRTRERASSASRFASRAPPLHREQGTPACPRRLPCASIVKAGRPGGLSGPGSVDLCQRATTLGLLPSFQIFIPNSKSFQLF